VSADGYLFWDSRFLRDAPFLDGTTLTDGLAEISWSETEGLFVLPTHARTHILQRPYFGASRPVESVAYEFSLSVTNAATEADYYALVRAKRRGAACNWCPFVWTEEVINPAVSSSTYTLTRKVAWNVVTGVTSTTHPALYYLDGVAGAYGTLSGRTLTASGSGELTVRYMPVFQVVVSGLSESVSTPNGLNYSATLTEVVSLA
jgi:hypothetical protein